MVRIAESEVEAAADTEVHFTGEGTAGGGGMVAGERRACVAERTAGGRLGGIMN